jgi:hypothetical protein
MADGGGGNSTLRCSALELAPVQALMRRRLYSVETESVVDGALLALFADGGEEFI